MDKKKINTIKMTRKIRDEHAKRLAGKSHSEQIAFYRERAKKLEKRLPSLLSELVLAIHHGQWENQEMDTALKRIREKRSPYKKEN